MSHERYMQRCLDLAAKGIADVAPNPMVGCVIVHHDQIIAEGYHQKFGEAHAEVNAIQAVSDQTLLKEATLYVNLEPCSHWGKTPPCTNLIIEKGIPRVVIGCIDTFAKVSGLGIQNLKAAGCEVTVGVLEKESRELNKRFFTFYTKSRPYVVLKWAQSRDGFMDVDRNSGEKGTFWITAPETKALVHKWRSEESAILVGKNTILNDDPQLTVRAVRGPSPTRFVIDPKKELELSQYKIGKMPPETHIITETEVFDILHQIKEHQLLSVLVEGGKYTLQKFLDSGLWDEIRILTGNVTMNSGVPAPEAKGKKVDGFTCGNDLIEIYRND